ncbi:SDR family NAD(P)-dependent oxidoreductase [Jiangella asiatica]|uniref:SDR family oxidoreductase n=1 Tax=Jiangella asiatica TaxID=2530372 RepID=A0A4R5D8A8_9ACTN|nr:SDR family oxidoreductase [Jiangella asiatica]TDE09696.1 SDR family oxidoreductase [Jiangella asiatica]
MTRFAGHTAIVTGAGAGIGRAAATAFASEGANVVAVDIDGSSARDAVAGFARSGDHLVIEADVSDPADIDRTLATTQEKYGRIDVVVNNAGILRLAGAWETPLDLFDLVLQTNLRSTFYLSTSVVRMMIESGTTGRIVNVSSIHAVRSEPNAIAYTTAKAGIEGMSRTLATEVAPHGITVNCVRPGATRTKLTEPIYTTEVLAALDQRIPLKRIAEAHEIAAGILFLASDAAAYITGTTLDIDGGYLMDGSLPQVRY